MKINFKSILSVLVLAFVSLFVLVGCGEEEVKDPILNLNITSATLKVGETKDVIVTIENLEGEVAWTSTDANVAVFENGKIKAVGVGSATLKASLGEKEATIAVTVEGEAKETFTVKFLDSDYSLLKSEVVEKGADATAPEVQDTDKKKFAGWDKEFTNVQGNLNIIAKYVNKYTITYNVNGGVLDGAAVESYFEGDETALPLAHKAGCKFVGWATTEDPYTYITALTAKQKGDVMLTAKFNEIESFNATFNFNGGISNDLYVASKDSAKATLCIDNYNTVNGSYWGGAYANYIFITNKANDPGATFSDRFYIGKDKETGLYKVIDLLLSGGSSWPSGAEYVITMSSSYKNHASVHSACSVKVEIGDYVVFDGDFTKISKTTSVNCYFFNTDPTATSVKEVINSSTGSLLTPVRLGYLFKGWKDTYGTEIKSTSDLYEGIVLEAQWEERTPVTEISTNEVPLEMVTGQTFKINAKVVPSDAYFQQVYFKTENKDLISIDDAGNIKALSTGTCKITMYDYMKRVFNEKTITVYPVDSIDINFGAFNGVLNVGETLELKPVAFGKTVEGLTFTYTSNNPAILEVDANGKVTAKANGVATITIKDSAATTHTLEIGVTVDPLVDTERVDQVLKLIAENNLATVQAGNACLYNDGTERYYKATYSSVNYFLFAPYVVNRKNANGTANPNGSPMVRRFDATHDDSIQFVTVHDTATLTGNPDSTSNSMKSSGTTGAATIHYVTGNHEIYQAVTEDFIAYHAGDGTGNKHEWYNTGVKAPTTGTLYPEYGVKESGNGYIYTINGQDTTISVPSNNPKLTHLGPVWKIEDGYYYIGKTWSSSDYGYVGSFGGNNNSIGIEMCVNSGGDIYDTWQRTAQLVADICLRNNLDLTRVKMHNTWTGKNCPQCLIAGNYWWNFMKMVEVNYEIMSKYSDAEITMVSNNPSIVDNTGRVIGAPEVTTTVSYDVTVSIGGVSKTMKLYSVVPGTTTWEQWNGSYPSSQIWNDGYFSKNDIVDLPYIF